MGDQLEKLKRNKQFRIYHTCHIAIEQRTIGKRDRERDSKRQREPASCTRSGKKWICIYIDRWLSMAIFTALWGHKNNQNKWLGSDLSASTIYIFMYINLCQAYGQADLPRVESRLSCKIWRRICQAVKLCAKFCRQPNERDRDRKRERTLSYGIAMSNFSLSLSLLN